MEANPKLRATSEIATEAQRVGSVLILKSNSIARERDDQDGL